MARVSTTTSASPEQVFELLTNGWRYAEWVVGTKRIRAVEPTWPAVGSRFFHAVGIGPLAIKDETEVAELVPGHRIALMVRVWPAGRGRATIDVEPEGSGARITIEEVPVEGPAKTLDNPLLEATAHLRNAESLRRLRRAVEEALIVPGGSPA